ncbi:related to Minichromosome maintenance protein 10 [Zygosaccharomyces bailii]|nr:related to Minichromosome maintenance protein 10 [Zygosaccharomyces bailii]
MQDPREVFDIDPYEALTSDEGEEMEIEAQLADIERRKKDLVQRLKIKKSNPKARDPNFEQIQVQSSPKKEVVSYKQSVHGGVGIQRDHTTVNPNEVKVQTQDTKSSNSTPYFIEKLLDSRRKQDLQIKARENLLSTRVHTFLGTSNTTEYKPVATNELDDYSNLWLNKRYLPKEMLRKSFSEVKILRLSKLFAKVKPPNFVEPQYSNWAAIGLISSKGEVKFTSSEKPKKYFKFTLTNFHYSIDTYIFGKDGVERYYNLRVGDIIAILNPEILPWRAHSIGESAKSFNLRISHNFHCILEIGSSRDLGWCPIFNRSQNKPCGAPINKDREECCEYHREIQFRSTNSKRIELSGSFALGAPTRADSRPALYREPSQNKPHYKLIPNGGQKGFTSKEHLLEAKGSHFSNRNAAKAFFDEKFQNPEILNNLASKRRKIADTRRSEALNRELKKGIEFNIEHKSTKELDIIKQATESTLGSGLIKNLGFDPTQGKLASVLKSSMKEPNKKSAAKDTGVSTLLKFRKAKVHLKPSRDVLIRQKSKREQVWQEHFGKHINQREELVNSDGSESELEIID